MKMQLRICCEILCCLRDKGRDNSSFCCCLASLSNVWI